MCLQRVPFQVLEELVTFNNYFMCVQRVPFQVFPELVMCDNKLNDL